MRMFVDRISTALACAGCAMILLCAALAVGNAAMRGAVQASIYGLNDTLALLLFVGVVACMPKANAAQSHMRVTLLGEALGGTGRRLVETFAHLLTFAFFAVLAGKSLGQAAELGRYDEVSDIAEIPLAPFWWVAAALLLVAALVQLWVLLDTLRGAPGSSARGA